MRVVFWFRRDLRVGDNTGLAAAVKDSGGDVVPVFVLDDDLLKGRNVAPARVQFLLHSLSALDGELQKHGARLVVRRGSAEKVLHEIVRESQADAVYFNRDYTPVARKRDGRIAQSLKLADVKVESFKDQVIFEEDELLTGQRKPYTVFTPYKKAWLARVGQPRLETGDWTMRASNFQSLIDNLPSAADLGFDVTQQLPTAGEAQAQAVLRAFVDGAIGEYQEQRNFLARPGTSHLSPYLRMGNVSPRQCLAAALDAKAQLPKAQHDDADTWISELIWRDFYQQILYHFPYAKKANFNRAYDGVRWGNGNSKRDEALFAAWCEGRTGYPIVDAAMRQMNQTGWMHNRARMIVASFLTKDLLLDWRLGDAYFMQKLVDGDPAANNGGWQWASSTGTDAQPYFRIFNPKLQSERFDPNGDYIRKWVPELARVPNDYIHEPSAMPPMTQAATKCTIGEDYPAPIVDHAEQKAEILRRFQALKR